jgi:hypothetical protein
VAPIPTPATPTLRTLCRIAAALGKRIVGNLRDAPAAPKAGKRKTPA